jgi:dehydrogenase/reductase SDR family protein 1
VFIRENPRLIKGEGILVAAALAQEYGFTDIDGKQPHPLTLQDV